MELSTPRCRVELEDETLLWEIHDLPKFWPATKSDLFTFAGTEYKVKGVSYDFQVEEGATDPETGEDYADHLLTTMTVTVEIKP